MVYRQKVPDIDHLKDVLCADGQDLIDGVINQWSEHLMMVIQAQGSRT